MIDHRPTRIVDDPTTSEELKEDLRRSSEVPLPRELREQLERLDWEELEKEGDHGSRRR